MSEVVVRPATAGDLDSLSQLALRSKGHWGYSAEFLEACRAELTLTPDRLETDSIWVAESAGRVAGFSAVRVDGDVAELVDLFVDPAAIGTGVGKLLWERAVADALDSGAKCLTIEADPHAEPWYIGKGAVRVGQVPSGSIPGRSLPLLELSLG